MPYLTCIIPHYNDSIRLVKAVQALLDQNFSDFEIIIVDDCSSDNSWEIIEQLPKKDSRIKIYRSEKNQGPIQTSIKGLHLSQGEIIYWGSSNDYVLPGFFKCGTQALLAHPQASFFCAGALFDSDKGKLEDNLGWAKDERYFSPKDLLKVNRIKTCCFHGQSVLFRRSCLPEHLPLDVKHNFDLFVYFVMALQYGFCYSPEIYSSITVEETSFSCQGPLFKDKCLKAEVFIKNLELPCFKTIHKPFIKSGFLSFLGLGFLWFIITHFKWNYISWKLTQRYSLLITQKIYQRSSAFIKKIFKKKQAHYINKKAQS